jgi:predicted PurR-regulated permease PerM
MFKRIEISHRTIIFTAIFALSLWFLFKIWDILLMVFVALILMSALKPAVDVLERIRIPRALAILVIYILLWGLVGLGVAAMIPPLVEQTGKLLQLLPSALAEIDIFNNNQQAITQQFLSQIGTLPQNLLRLTAGVFGNLLTVFTTLVITFYFLLERKHLDRYLGILLGSRSPEKVSKTIDKIEKRLGGWVRGQLFLMLSIGVMTYIGLLILGVDSALPLAILAGLLEVVPNIGPTVSAVPAILVALTIHPLTALATAALYFLVQILENNFMVPHVMQRAVGVNPLISILGLIIGFRLSGPAGAVLAIPLVIVIQTIGVEAFSKKLVPGEE